MVLGWKDKRFYRTFSLNLQIVYNLKNYHYKLKKVRNFNITRIHIKYKPITSLNW